jgi:hypothetical protein
MLGPPKPRHLDGPVTVSLEQLVPRTNFYRHLENRLDLSFVHDWTRELYAERGRPSIDPVVFFKLQRIIFFEGFRSERQLIATASLNLAHRWYLGYALDDPLPDHSSLTTATPARARIRLLGRSVCDRRGRNAAPDVVRPVGELPPPRRRRPFSLLRRRTRWPPSQTVVSSQRNMRIGR